MTEEEAIKIINSAISKGWPPTGKPKSYLLEIEGIFKNNLLEFNKLLDKAKENGTELYRKYLELLQIKGASYKYSSIKGLEGAVGERPPITVITFGEKDLDHKLKVFNQKIEDYKNG